MVVLVAALITQPRLLAALATRHQHLHHKVITAAMVHRLRVAQIIAVVVEALEQQEALQAAQPPVTVVMALHLALVVLQ
jgi:hypothetical protein